MYVLSTDKINKLKNIDKLKKHPLKSISVNVSTVYRIRYNFVTISLRENEINKKTTLLIYSYIKYLVSMKYVELTQRTEECTWLSEGESYNFVLRSYELGTKPLVCKYILIPTPTNSKSSNNEL